MRTASLIGPVVAAITLGGAGTAHADAVVLADGHVDYAARIVAGQLRSQVKDGTQGADHVVWRDPGTVVFEVRAAARTTVPADARLRFLGPPGTVTSMIPQVQKPGILWAGWNTEELTGADVIGPVTWTLQNVDGPGAVAVFQTGSFGDPDVIFNSGDGLPDGRRVPLATHAHGNWAFSRPGSYRLTFQITAVRPSGQQVADTQTLNVLVDAPPASDPGPPPSDTSAPPSPDGASGPSKPSTSGGKRDALTLHASRPRLRGRTLAFTALIARSSRLDVTVRRAARVVTRAKVRTVGASLKRRTLRVRLGRRLAPGRTYKVTIRVRAGGETAARTLTFHVPEGRAR